MDPAACPLTPADLTRVADLLARGRSLSVAAVAVGRRDGRALRRSLERSGYTLAWRVIDADPPRRPCSHPYDDPAQVRGIVARHLADGGTLAALATRQGLSRRVFAARLRATGISVRRVPVPLPVERLQSAPPVTVRTLTTCEPRGRRNWPRLSDPQREWIAAEVARGVSVRQIARAAGLSSDGALTRVLARSGLRVCTQRRAVVPVPFPTSPRT